ncbi:MAG: ABC transporter permease [Chloroflexota bacterium]
MATIDSSTDRPGRGDNPGALARTVDATREFFVQMAQRPLAFAGMVIVFLFIILAAIGPAVAPYSFREIIRADDRRAIREVPPSLEFPFGTDDKGRDVFSRVLWGARDTIGLPAIATLISVAIGTVIGLATGYAGGWVDEVVSRALDILLAIPALVLALVMLTTFVPVLNNSDSWLVETFGATNISITLVIVLLYVPIVTRVIRSAVLNIRDSGFVEAARLRGEWSLYILFREIFPGVLPALVVEASLRLSYAIFLVASLGFLGLGVQPPSPEWGTMVLDARDKLATSPWALWFPAGAIVLFIVSINLMSDGLRRVFRYE